MPKKTRTLNKGYKHIPGGNCWEGIQSPSEEDECVDHYGPADSQGCAFHPPRGECPECPRCPACDNMNLAMSLAGPDPQPTKLAVVPQPTRVYLPSASKTDHLFACTWPFGRSVPHEQVGDRTRFGSAFHEVMESTLRAGLNKKGPKSSGVAAAAKKWDVDVNELNARVVEGAPVIQAWLKGGNMWGLDFTKGQMHLEVSVGYTPKTGEARVIPGGPGPDHDYPERQDGEVPGTADVVALSAYGKPNPPAWWEMSRIIAPRTLLVLDHKSGWNVGQEWQPQTPAESGQLLTLAAALSKLHEVDQIILAFFHARRDSTPIILDDMVTASDLETHRKRLVAAMKNIGSEWMRPGPWCTHCRARSICPTRTTALTALGKPPGPMTSQRVGHVHQTLAEWRKLEEDLVAEMRSWVKANGPAQRPDGWLVDLVPRKRTNLSQASVIRAFGPLKGAKILAQLRAAGAIEEIENLELRAVPR